MSQDTPIAPQVVGDDDQMAKSLQQDLAKVSEQIRKRIVGQDEVVELFKKLLENVYIVAMEEYGGQTVRYGKEKTDGKRASVETFILQPTGVETPVIYRLRLKQDKWSAYDVIVEGVSLVSNYRSSFRTIARKEGMEGLLSKLREKVAAPPNADA